MKAEDVIFLAEEAAEDMKAGTLENLKTLAADAGEDGAYTHEELRGAWLKCGADAATLEEVFDSLREQPAEESAPEKKISRFERLNVKVPRPWSQTATDWRRVPSSPGFAYSPVGGFIRYMKRDNRVKLGLQKRRIWRGRTYYEPRIDGKKCVRYEINLMHETGHMPFGYYPKRKGVE